jgi:Ser/Thr protein kinase RdoA (MazF antagonist)
VALWTYYEELTSPSEAPSADYADALGRLHAGMRQVDLATPHFMDRVAQAEQLVASRDRTPDLADADRELLHRTLRNLRRAINDRGTSEQLLHGEPHPGNVLSTNNGPLFVDLETCCRGPVEFDLAHVPEKVSETTAALIRDCCARADSSCSRWSQPGAGTHMTNSRTASEPNENSSACCATARRGQHPMP